MDCLESWSCPDAEVKFSNFIRLSENQTTDRAMVGNWFRGKTTVFGSVLSIWIVLVNLIVCAAFFVDKRTGISRWDRNASDISRNTSWLAVNFSFVQLAIGFIIVPVTLITESKGIWSLGLVTCRLWLMAQTILVANTFWSLAALTLGCLIHKMAPEYHRKLTGRKSSTLALVVFVWVLSGLVLVPLWTREDFVLEEVCAVNMTKDDAIVFLLSAFLFPGSAIVACSVAILAVEMLAVVRDTTAALKLFDVKTQMSPESELRSERSSAKDSTMAAILFIDICSLVTWTPSFIVNTLVPYCDEMCVDPGLWTFFLWLGYANAGLAPIFWIIDGAVRTRIGSLFKSISCRGSRPTESEQRAQTATTGLPFQSDAMLARSIDVNLWADDEKVQFVGGSDQSVAAQGKPTSCRYQSHMEAADHAT